MELRREPTEILSAGTPTDDRVDRHLRRGLRREHPARPGGRHSVEASGVPDRMAEIGADRPTVVEALTKFDYGTRQYLLVTTVFGFIVAVLDANALAIMGIPLAITWGVLAFVTNYIPNVGFILGVIPPALLGLLTGGPGLMVAVIVVYCVLNLVIQSIIQPRFIGDAVGLSTTLTFVALVFWAWL